MRISTFSISFLYMIRRWIWLLSPFIRCFSLSSFCFFISLPKIFPIFNYFVGCSKQWQQLNRNGDKTITPNPQVIILPTKIFSTYIHLFKYLIVKKVVEDTHKYQEKKNCVAHKWNLSCCCGTFEFSISLFVFSHAHRFFFLIAILFFFSALSNVVYVHIKSSKKKKKSRLSNT